MHHFQSTSKMSDPTPDPYEAYPIKDNLWLKNNEAHKMMRSKQNSKEYCTYCRHHHCYDPTIVYGNRSLKKSKVVQCYKTKYIDKIVISPDFVNIRNGENNLDDYDLE
jgi:hypothetical protein